MNSLHHSMGERPLYPFILTPVVRSKLRFVHRIITRQVQPADRDAIQTDVVAA
jgi:hypothetical protein